MICSVCGHSETDKSRSVRQNSFRWAVISWLFQHDNHELPSEEAYHNWLKVKAGWIEPLMERDGTIIGFIPKRTDFRKMNQEEFNRYFEDIQNTIWKEVVPNHGEDFERELCNQMRIYHIKDR